MIIYSESRRQFLEDIDQNDLHRKLCDAFRARTGGVPADHHVWADEYTRLSLALRRAHLEDETQVAIEYHVSAAGRFRIDALLAGSDGTKDHAVILELKAWSSAGSTEIPGMVWAPVGGGKNAQHPCQQARGYSGMIERFNEDVRATGVRLHPAAYLFNLHRRQPEPLEDARYADILQDSRLFLAGDLGDLTKFLERYLRHRPSTDVVALIDSGRLVPAPALIERVHSMLEGNEEFHLLDAQYEAFQVIQHALRRPSAQATRRVFIVEGGPGTGKSVIAVRLLADVLARRQMGFLVAPNQAFRATLIEALSKGNRGYREDGRALIHSSWSFHTADYEKQRSFDVLIVDEAHRLKDTAYQYKGESMVEDMVRAARISVFFVDETQRVAWADTGGIERIRAAAAKFGAVVEPSLRLTAQFRCSGSDGYLAWLDDVLQIRATANFDNWADGQYEFRVFDRAKELHEALRARNAENRARLIAGYTWPWPTKARHRDGAAMHVVADDLRLPWNYPETNWATALDGLDQVGCVHTCQGVEFDWIGVLVGDDLRFVDDRVQGHPASRARTDASLKGWKAALKAAKGDPVRTAAVLERVQQLIKSTYKVLMSRGRRGCYVWCADPALRDYLRARVALAQSAPAPASVGAPLGWLAAEPAGHAGGELVPVGFPWPKSGPSGPVRGWIRRPADLPAEPGLFVVFVAEAARELGLARGSWAIVRAAEDPKLAHTFTATPAVGGGAGLAAAACRCAVASAPPASGDSVLLQLVRTLGQA